VSFNLFFNGETAQPDISAGGAINNPSFAAYNGINYDLGYNNVVPNAGLTFVDGASLIELRSAIWEDQDATYGNPIDQVQPFQTGPADGIWDFMGRISIRVNPVPEPSAFISLATGCLGLLAFGGLGRKK
jgi:hypothetical protein